MQNKALLIFIKNPELGKAKTRIAKTVGDEKALQVYLELLKHTRKVATQVEANRYLFYSQFIDRNDDWDNALFDKKLQAKLDLGARMSAAFQKAFEGNEKVVIIGSDCASLNIEMIKQAFQALETDDFVIGPAEDGGYYLLGMNNFQPVVFQNIEWSTEQVLPRTIEHIIDLDATYTLLPTLSDIDYWEDWLKYGWEI